MQDVWWLIEANSGILSSFRWERISWITNSKLNDFSKHWQQLVRLSVRLNLDHICFSKIFVKIMHIWQFLIFTKDVLHVSRFRLQINNCWIYLIFSYIIEQDVCFLTLCDRNFSKKLAYSFLEDLSQEFYNQYGHKINTATRPYSFIEFGKFKHMQASCLNFWQRLTLRHTD